MLGKLRLLFWIGIVLLFLPFFGIPSTWKTLLTILAGIGIAYLAFRLRYAYKKMKFEMRQAVPPADNPTIIHG